MIKIEGNSVTSEGTYVDILTETTLLIKHIIKHYDISKNQIENIVKYAYMSKEELRNEANKKLARLATLRGIDSDDLLMEAIGEFLKSEDCENCSKKDTCELTDFIKKVKNHDASFTDILEFFSKYSEIHKDNDPRNDPRNDSDDNFFNVFKDLL